MDESPLGGLEHLIDRGGEDPPLRPLSGELFPAQCGQRVELGPASFGARAPLGTHPPAFLNAVEGGIEAALSDLEHIPRELPHSLGYSPAMEWTEEQGLQNEQVERTLQEIRPFRHGVLGG